jgi:phenylacetate-CoA ligase
MNLGIMLRALWLRRTMLRRDRWTPAHLAAHQARRLRALRAHAYTRSPFYRDYHAGLAGRPLHELPILTKSLLMEHFNRLVTDPAVRLDDVEAHVATLRDDDRFLGRYRVCATSGSTGRRGFFLFDRAEWGDFLASWARGHDWTGHPAGLGHRMRMASVVSTVPWHMSARVAATLRGPWVPTLRLDAAAPVDRVVARLNAWQPEMLIAYPSKAAMLADEQRAGRLRIDPTLVFTSAELLTDEMRRRIETAWGNRLFNQYAATEGGGLGAECERHTGLHLFEDRIIFEVVDRDNRPVAPGTFGDKLLITVLGSRTLPLIRYELSDSLRRAAEPCPCGRPYALVDAIGGREEEVLRLPAVSGGEVAVHPLTSFHRVMDTVPTGGGWQVIQESDRLRLLVAGLGGRVDAAALADTIRATLTAQGVAVPPVVVERVAAIPRGPTGKAPLVVSKIGPKPSP